MKKFIFSLIPLALLSCTSNHFHDGIYVRGLGVNNALSNEVLKVNGNEIFHYQYTFSGEFQGESKILCTQYEDRIEFNEGGEIKILRIVDSGTLKLNDLVYYTRMGNLTDNYTVNKKEPNPLIRTDGKTITVLPEKQAEAPITNRQRVKIYTGEDYSYDYVESVSINPSEVFFQGTKTFVGHIDDVYTVNIEGDRIIISDSQDLDKVILNGRIDGGRILINQGLESNFRYVDGILYYHGSPNEWYLNYELVE